jgi:hypothetical protein
MATGKGMVTGIFRVSYAHVFKPEDRDEGEKKVWSVTGIFDPKDPLLAEMREMAKKCGLAKWPKKKGWILPFRNGVEKDDDNPRGYDLEKNPEYKGKVIVKLSSYGRPIKLVYNKVDETGQRIAIEDEAHFYSGCYARAYVTCFAFDNPKKQGVSFGVSSIVKIRDGEPLINMADPTKEFESIKPEDYDADNSDLLVGYEQVGENDDL